MNESGESQRVSEKDVATAICKMFSKDGYSCRANYPLNLRGMRLILDVFCQKGRERIAIEIKTLPSVSERDVQQVISYSRFAPNTRWFLCIPSSTELSNDIKVGLKKANIGLLLFRDGEIKIEYSAVSYTEVRDQLAKSITDLTQECLKRFKTSVFQVDSHLELPLQFWRTGRGRYAHRVSPKEVEESYWTYLSALKEQLSLIDTSLARTIPFEPRISSELLDRIGKLKNVRYARHLADFEKAYRNANSPESEYQIVLETLKILWKTYEKEKGAAAFKIYKDFEPMLKQISWYRDHLIHPFQVFLMGSIIIDEYYPEFQKSFRTRLQNSIDGDLDFAWLLSSTFHDFCYPIQMYEYVNREMFKKFLQVKETSILPRLQTERILVERGQLRLIDQIISLLCHCTSKTKDTSWIFDSKCKIDDELRFVFLKAMTEKKNHAPLSALTLFNMILSERVAETRPEYIRETFSTAVYPGGLAIAIHDPDILKSLPQKINVLFDTMPIACLLVYCDTAQEFGRSGNKEYCTLKSIGLGSNLVETKLAYSNKTAYKKKTKEVDYVLGKLRSNAIQFKISIAFAEEEYSKVSKGGAILA